MTPPVVPPLRHGSRAPVGGEHGIGRCAIDGDAIPDRDREPERGPGHVDRRGRLCTDLPGDACAGPAAPTNSAPATVPALIAPAATRRHELREINMISSLVKIPESS